MQIPTTITAHSGCERTADDSLESVRAGIDCGADYVEVDVRRAPGGELVVSHDRRESYEEKPRLAEAMALVAGSPRGVGLNCDIKEAQVLYDVLTLGEQYGLAWDRLALSGSIYPSTLQADAQLVRRARVYLNIEEIIKELYLLSRPEEEQAALRALSPWEVTLEHAGNLLRFAGSIVQTCRDLHVTALNFPIKLVNGVFREGFHELAAEVPLSIWTVNDSDALQRLLQMQVCNITTRTVSMAVSLRGAQGQ